MMGHGLYRVFLLVSWPMQKSLEPGRTVRFGISFAAFQLKDSNAMMNELSSLGECESRLASSTRGNPLRSV